jgi:nickel-type superoxide dismutase maturation protease
MPVRGLTWPLLALLALAAARRWLDVVEVRGQSMAPTLLPGDRLLVVRSSPRTGQVVLAPDPRSRSRELIKRAVALDRFGAHLRGDNPAFSSDTRTFGAVPRADVRWRAVLRYWPPGRIGSIPAAPPDLERVDDESGAMPAALVADRRALARTGPRSASPSHSSPDS